MIGFDLHALAWRDEEIAALELPSGTMRIRSGFGSGLTRRASDLPGVVWAVCDRGPNLKPKTLVKRYGFERMRALTESGAKVMPRLDLGPAIAKLQVNSDRVECLEVLRLADDRGEPLSGLPIPGGEHARHEPAYDMEGTQLPPDPNGFDTEGIAALAAGGFWLGDEFGPSLLRVDGAGRVQARHVPAGTVLDGARYPVKGTLPAIAAKRQLNRGFEAVALSPDEKWLFLVFQSPLAHPDEAAHANARHVRVWRLDAASLEVAAQYAYPFDPPDTFRRDNATGGVEWSDLKVSEIVALDCDNLLVLERASQSTKIYRVNLADDRSLGAEHLDAETRPSLEELSAGPTGTFASLGKELVFTSDNAPQVAADLEGMIVLSPSELLLVNDNDFGVEGAKTSFWKVEFSEPILQ
jgi:hypothetical protein